MVESGEAALELLMADAAAFDLVVLDVMLPGKDGFAVIAELRDSGRFIPTLMLTARGHPEDVLRGFAAGADDYLAKPFELSILIARIGGLLRRHEWLRNGMTDESVADFTARADHDGRQRRPVPEPDVRLGVRPRTVGDGRRR